MAFLSVATLKSLRLSRSISSTNTTTTSRLFAEHTTLSRPTPLLISPFSSRSYDLERTDKGFRMLTRNVHPYVIEGSRSSYYMECDDEALQFRVDLPGVSKQGLKVWTKKSVIQGSSYEALYFEAEEAKDDTLFTKESARKFMGFVNLSLPQPNYKVRTAEMKAVLNNGVLKGRVPIVVDSN